MVPNRLCYYIVQGQWLFTWCWRNVAFFVLWCFLIAGTPNYWKKKKKKEKPSRSNREMMEKDMKTADSWSGRHTIRKPWKQSSSKRSSAVNAWSKFSFAKKWNPSQHDVLKYVCKGPKKRRKKTRMRSEIHSSLCIKWLRYAVSRYTQCWQVWKLIILLNAYVQLWHSQDKGWA